MPPAKIAVLVGSLRKASYARMVAKELVALAPPVLEFEFVDIGRLPHYNADLETAEPPEPWAVFRQKMREFSGFLFVTPEYNRSMPGVLKNALDVGSRPYGKSVWPGKPGAVASVSPGAIGAFGANHHLRQCLVYLDVPCMAQPEAYIGGADKLFDAEGRLASDRTRDFLKAFMESFGRWVKKGQNG